eukprot:gnl/MRDRNA2_/MRDRNA2_116787_c0_seq1.p1 gnl/MRDRNA2_/MRDRNA2_116787_c0~~gnl/MRDRNA2_/MRDRNA2_116787_c0_seq1.p1  ORF type:complete len:584 (+),score=85.05 gnl/MRDRNA2_/MRDRNA2_116787_c0_seq1:146-1897(+)
MKDTTDSKDAYAVFKEMFDQHEVKLKAMICELHAQHDLHSRQVMNRAIREALNSWASSSVDSSVNNILEHRGSASRKGSGVLPVASEAEPVKQPSRPQEEPACLTLNAPQDVEVAEVHLSSSSVQKESAPCIVNNYVGKTTPRTTTTQNLAAQILETGDGLRKSVFSDKGHQQWMQIKPVPAQDSLHSQVNSTESRVAQLVKSSHFDFMMALLIVLSAIFIFAQTEWASQNPEADIPMVFVVADICFTIIFTVELGLKVSVLRRSYFTGPDRGWHFVDTVVVATALIELVAASSFLKNMVVLRLLRILRIVRVMRILRAFKVFTNLRMMVMGIISCGNSLFWAIVLLMLIIIIFAACLTQVVNGALAEGMHPFSVQEMDLLKMSYGSLFRTVYSLFKAVAGGQSWCEFADPLLVISPALCLLFCLFILFVTFAVLNIITGIFVENSFKSMDDDREMKIIEGAGQMEVMVNEVKAVFTELDVDQSGLVDWNEFRSKLHDAKLQSYFQQLDLDVHSEEVARHLFMQLDFDQSGQMDADEFVFGLARLKGPARSVDIARVLHNQRSQSQVLLSMTKDIARLRSYLE